MRPLPSVQGCYPGLSRSHEDLGGQATALLDATTIAKDLGILCKSNISHAQAVTVMIKKLSKLPAVEYAMTPYNKNGHDGTVLQYAASVELKVEIWPGANCNPTTTINDGVKNYAARYGNGKKISA